MTWIQTYSGVPWDLLNPRAEDVRLRDLAYALAHLSRFTGHCGSYSVAQHSVLVAQVVSDRYDGAHAGHATAVLGALLHDSHEAYLGDISSPMKRVFNRRAPGYVGELEAAHDRAIAEWADIHPDYLRAIHVKEADRVLLATERRDLLGDCSRDWPDLPPPLPERIELWPAEEARDIFGGMVCDLLDQIDPGYAPTEGM